MLEHVDDLGRTVREIARVLRPGGVFLYDTINRTRRSRLLVIKLSQDWAATRWARAQHPRLAVLIRPAELERKLAAAGLDVRDRVGLALANLLAAVRHACRARGKITYAELGRRHLRANARAASGCTPGMPSSGRPADQRRLLLRTTHP